MKPAEVLELLETLMELHGLLEEGWTYGLDNTKSQYGVCCDDRRYIGISRKLAAINPDAETKHTVLHEIAHALVGGGHGHDEIWASCCVRIGGDGKEFYGCHAARPKAGVKSETVFYLPHIP